MDFKVLGPVEVRHGNRVLDVGRRRERCLLGLLLLETGRVVHADRLVALLWDDDPPSTALLQLRANVSRLRRRLDPEGGASPGGAGIGGASSLGVRIATDGGGYLADVDPRTVDAHRFRAAVTQARKLPDVAAKATRLRDALALWRGPLLADAASDRLRGRIGAGLDELRLSATELMAECELALGNHEHVAPTLVELVERHPLQEHLIGLLMLAYYRDGRQADALRVYRDLQLRLADELGLDPGRDVRELRDAILRADPALDWAAGAPGTITVTRSPHRVVPAQLPPDVAGFTGRDEALKQLDELTPGIAARVTAIGGTAGVGKTALAVHWAHRVADRFPDGQLYVNLRGFDPTVRATVSPAEAVRGFLDALGRAAAAHPGRRWTRRSGSTAACSRAGGCSSCWTTRATPNRSGRCCPARAGLPRGGHQPQRAARAGGRRGRPPADPRPAARRRGAGAAGRRLGADRVARRAGGRRRASSPVRAAAAGVGDRRRPAPRPSPASPLATLAEELRRRPGRLDAFAGGDPATDVRAVFSWSYRTLRPPAARLFRLLGLHPGPDIAAPAVASLAGMEPAGVRPLLAELTRAHLLAEPAAGRFALHDLLHAYAAELADATDTEADRDAAGLRILDYYLHTAYAASLRLEPHRDPIPLSPAVPGVQPTAPADQHEATDWFVAEQPVLLAAVEQAASSGLDRHAWQLAWTLGTFLDRQCLWPQWAQTQRLALDAAHRQADPDARARMHRAYGRVLARLQRYDRAHTHLRRALDLLVELGDHGGQARTHGMIARVYDLEGRYDDALDEARRSLARYRAGGDRTGEARALGTVGWYMALTGDHEGALASCAPALALLEDAGDEYGQADVLDSLALAHHRLGDFVRAAASYQRSLALFHKLGDRYNEADVLTRLGDVHHASGDVGAARRAWRSAQTILDQLGQPGADALRTRLHSSAAP